jgi:hypothetical protein
VAWEMSDPLALGLSAKGVSQCAHVVAAPQWSRARSRLGQGFEVDLNEPRFRPLVWNNALVGVADQGGSRDLPIVPGTPACEPRLYREDIDVA